MLLWHQGWKQKLYAADEDSSYVCVELRDNENSPLYVHVLLWIFDFLCVFIYIYMYITWKLVSTSSFSSLVHLDGFLRCHCQHALQGYCRRSETTRSKGCIWRPWDVAVVFGRRLCRAPNTFWRVDCSVHILVFTLVQRWFWLVLLSTQVLAEGFGSEGGSSYGSWRAHNGFLIKWHEMARGSEFGCDGGVLHQCISSRDPIFNQMPIYDPGRHRPSCRTLSIS